MFENQSISLSHAEKSRFLAKTYGWMALALFISAATSFFTAVSVFSNGTVSGLGSALYGKGFLGISCGGLYALCILEVLIVLWLSSRIRELSFGAAMAGFILYSVVNGITLSSIFIIYEMESITNAFLSTAVTFLVMCLFGSKTKSDLTSAGRYLSMALLGIIAATLVNFLISIFTGSSITVLDLIISIATVIVFTGLTAWDAQKIIRTAEMARNTEDYNKVAILGALELYLDFVNLLLALLRLFGKRKN